MNIRRIQLSAASFATRLSVIALVALTLVSSALGQSYQTEIQWKSDVEAAKRLAIEENKLVLLHFTASWCRPCRSLETFVFKSKSVQDAISESVIPVKVDADEALDLVNEFDVQIVPFDIVITPKGRVVSERRSPADSANYAKMISSTSTASRSLEREKMGPIAHQRTIAKTRLVSQPGPESLRPKAPSLEEFGLSKDSSRLQRKNAAFSLEGNPKKQTNPWVKSGNDIDVAADETPLNIEAPIQVGDLERKKIVSNQHELIGETSLAGRPKPKRIINERYFEARGISSKPEAPKTADEYEKNNPFKLISSPSTPEDGELDLPLDEAESDVIVPDDEEIESGSALILTSDENEPQVLDTELSETEDSLELGLDLSAETETQKAEEVKFALRGKCPVTLVSEGRWTDGDPKFGIVHRDRTYLFASAEKLEQFRLNPDGYSPLLAGYDPVVYHEEGKLVDGMVEHGVFMGRTPSQQVILFKDAATRGKFQNDPQRFLQTVRQATRQTSNNATMMR